VLLNKDSPHCNRLLKRKGCCGKYIGSNYGLFASNKSCLKSDKNSEKKILEILQQGNSAFFDQKYLTLFHKKDYIFRCGRKIISRKHRRALRKRS
jgi:hypothetical protein